MLKVEMLKRAATMCREDGFLTLASRIRQRGGEKLYGRFPEATRFLVPDLLSVAIEPTSVCNLRCKTCYSLRPKLYPPRKRGFMEWDLYRRVVDEIAGFGYSVNLGLNFGGESLLHNKFADMLNYAASKGVFKIGFNTNGAMLSRELSKEVVKNVDNIVISLDGLGEKHESLRVGSNYETVEKNILDLIDARGGANKPQISVNLTLSDHSAKDVSDFIEQWVHRVDCVQVYPCYSENLQIVNERAFFDRKTVKRRYCTWPFSYLAILWNGDVTTCCHDIGGVNTLGNVANGSVSDIRKSANFAHLRKEAASNRFNPASLCYKCDIWQTEFEPLIEEKDGILIQYTGQCKSYQLLPTKKC